MDEWEGKRCVIRETDTKSAEEENEEEKVRELYPLPLLLVVRREIWVRGENNKTEETRWDKETEWDTEKEGFWGKHPYERERGKKKRQYLL